MTERKEKGGAANTGREQRLAEALRANLRRRKEQARDRKEADHEKAEGGVPAKPAADD